MDQHRKENGIGRGSDSDSDRVPPHCSVNNSCDYDDNTDGSDSKSEILKQGVFVVYYPSGRPVPCQLTLTNSELLLEEQTEKDNESDIDNDISESQERYSVKDIYGFHIVREESGEITSTSAYACIILYSKIDENKSSSRSRIARVFEINHPLNSYEQNLDIAKDWAVKIGQLLKQQFPNLNSYNYDDDHETIIKDSDDSSLTSQIEDSFQEIKKITDRSAPPKYDLKSSNDEGYICKPLDLEFDAANFLLVKTILFNRHFLVVINPVSGQGKGTNLFQEYILPVFTDSGIQVTLLTTKEPGHAHSYITSSDFTCVDGIISVGGDGLLNEIVNGLRSKDTSGKFSKIPIGVVATGSGNGLARSMADYSNSWEEYKANPTLHSTLSVARGCVSPVNLTEVSLDKKVFYSFLSVGWGLMSDIDIDSEVLRAIGEIRFFIWGFIKVAKLKRYKAELSYIPYDSSGSVNSRVKVDDEFVCVYSACQSYIGSYMLFAPDAKRCDNTIHLTYLPSSTGRLAAAKFLARLDGGQGSHLSVNPVKYVKVKEFTLRCEGGIEGCLTMDGEQVHGEEITVKLCDSPLYVLSMG